MSGFKTLSEILDIDIATHSCASERPRSICRLSFVTAKIHIKDRQMDSKFCQPKFLCRLPY